MNALEESIVTLAMADTGSDGMNHPQTGAIGGFHQGVAPEGTPFPRMRFQQIDDIGVYSFSRLVADHCFYSLVFDAVDDPQLGEGAAIAGDLAERARSKFTDPHGLTVNGKTLLYYRFRHALTPMFTKDSTHDRYIYTKGMVLEIWLA